MSFQWLLIFVPVAIFLRLFPSVGGDTTLFCCSCLAIIPLAGWMGRATEELAEHVGQGPGALLNAAFGNAAELIIALIALSRGLTGIVKASIAGSIIGNLLLVLGLSILCGGRRHAQQRLNGAAARTSSITLNLAAIALAVPTLFHFAAGAELPAWRALTEQKLSLALAFVLLATYACLLRFELKTHKQLYAGPPASMEALPGRKPWSRGRSLLVLILSAALVGLISEFLVGTVESARQTLGVSEVFVGVIVVAIIGNVAEHSTAVLMAMKDKIGLSYGIAVGSSLQMALFVAPLLVFVSYAFGRPMDLEFTLPEIAAVLVAVHLVFQISADGETNWIEGIQLLALYLILAILFYYLPPALARA